MSNVTRPEVIQGNTSFLYYASPSVSYGVAVTVSSTLAFGCLNLMVRHGATPEGLPNVVKRWVWQNTLVSCIHAFISGTSALIGLGMYTEMLQDMRNYNNYHVYTLTSFVLGYFVYDALDVIVSGMSRQRWEVLVHHAVSIGLMVYMVLARYLAANTTFTMFAEVNSVFLHLRKLLQLVKVETGSWYYRVVITLNLITFVLFRGVAFGWLIVALYLWCTEVNIVAVILTFNCTFVLAIMNAIFFWRLFKNDALRRESRRESKTALNNNNTETKKTT